MAVADSVIEERVVAYISDVLGRNEVPTRHNAIRQVTGDVDVLPSAVAKVLTRMIDERKIRHLRSNDRLEFVD